MAKSNKQFEKVFAVLLAANGSVVTKADLVTALGESVALYRISTYVWNMRKRLGADIKVEKQGKLVTGYRLMNANKFANVQAVTAVAATVPVTPRAPKVAAKPRVAVAAMAKKAPADEPAMKIGEVSASVDPAFDSFDVADIISGN